MPKYRGAWALMVGMEIQVRQTNRMHDSLGISTKYPVTEKHEITRTTSYTVTF